MRSTATPSGPAISDQTLLGRLQAGDEGALGALYERYVPLLFSLAIRVVGDRQLAQEVIQDTFLRCWDQAERYDPARGQVPAWLIGVTRNRAIDVLRSRSHQARLRERATLPGPGSLGEPRQPDDGEGVLLRRAVSTAVEPCPTRSVAPSSSRTTAACPRRTSRRSRTCRWEPSRGGFAWVSSDSGRRSRRCSIGGRRRRGWSLHDARESLELERSRVVRLEQELVEQRAIASLVARTDTHVAGLRGSGAAAHADGWIVWSPSRREGFAVVHHLPSLPAGQHYRLWVVNDAVWLPAGQFEVDAIGHAALIVRAPREQPERFAITVEPVASGVAPSRPPVMEGRVSS